MKYFLNGSVEGFFTKALQDPVIKERVIQLAVGFATGPLKRNAQFAFRVFEYTLDSRCPDDPASTAYNDAVKDFNSFSLYQLQRLAMRFPDYLIVSIIIFSFGVLSFNFTHRPFSMKWRRESKGSVNLLQMSRLEFDTPQFYSL